MDTLEKAAKYAKENDIDVVYNGELVAGPTTQGFFKAVDNYNDRIMQKGIQENVSTEELKIMGTPSDEFCSQVIGMLKDPKCTADDVEKLFEGKNVEDWTNSPEQRYSLLHFACRYNRADCVKFALAKGCSVFSMTWKGNSPATYAINYNASREVLDMLYEVSENSKDLMEIEMGPEDFKKFTFSPTWTPTRDEVPGNFFTKLMHMATQTHQEGLDESSPPLPSSPREIIDLRDESKLSTKAERVYLQSSSSKEKIDGREKKIPKNAPTDEEPFECMICMNAKPDTIVHPCGHCVVCKSCSEKLRDTADKERCVMCRQTIEWIEED